MSFGAAPSGPVTRIERPIASAHWDDLFSPSACVSRHTLARLGWGALAGMSGIGSLTALGAGVFAPPEFEEISTPWSEDYAVNTMLALVFLASALGGLGVFSTWKASHRPGLGFWRATARPALMSFCGAMFAAATNFSANFSTGRMQWVGLALMAVSLSGFLFFWLLRGPDYSPQAQDAYWGRALSRLFLVAAILACAGSTRLFQTWIQDGRIVQSGPTTETRIVPVLRWDRVEREWRTQEKEYLFPRFSFDLRPIGSAMLAMFTIGCLSETLHRRRLGRAASGLSFGRTS